MLSSAIHGKATHGAENAGNCTRGVAPHLHDPGVMGARPGRRIAQWAARIAAVVGKLTVDTPLQAEPIEGTVLLKGPFDTAEAGSDIFKLLETLHIQLQGFSAGAWA